METQSFVSLTPELARAYQRASESSASLWVVTANERLRRHWRLALEDLASGPVWRTPQISSIEVFLSQGYQRLWRSRAQHYPAPISEATLRLTAALTQPPVSEQTNSENQAVLLQSLVDAWRLQHRYCQELPVLFAEPLNSSQRFAQSWLHALASTLEEQHWISGAQVPRLLTQALKLSPEALRHHFPDQLWLVGFDQTEPALAELWTTLSDCGVTIVQVAEPTQPTTESARVEAASATEEFRLAAVWARQILEAAVAPASPQSSPRIGIVHPNLQTVRGALARTLSAELHPLKPSNTSEIFAIGGGTPLANEPLCADALLFLRWGFNALATEPLQQLFTSGAFANIPALTFAPTLPRTCSLTTYARTAAADAPPIIIQLANQLRQLPTLATINQWLLHFRALLQLAGWGESDLGSVAYQAWQQSLLILESPIPAPAPLSASQALTYVTDLMASHTFAPQNPEVPVLVLGSLESTGLQFTHLWVMGMQDVNWPAAAQANPLVPLSVQRQLGVPRVDSAGELRFAQSRIEHWRCSSERLIFSHALVAEDTTYECSALISQEPKLETSSWSKTPLNTDTLVAQPYQESWVPVPVPAADAKISGGTRLLGNQAACPFKAFAVHRLQLDQPSPPHSFPDARERGIVVHSALQAYVEQFAAGLPTTPATTAELDAIAELVVAQEYGRFPPSIRRLETDYLRQLLEQFQAFEIRRRESDAEPIMISTNEQDATLQLGKLGLRLRIDRIDDHVNGKSVIDYKTGAISINRLRDERLTQPQLAAYALAVPDTEAVVLYQVGAQEVKAQTLGSIDLGLQKSKANQLSAQAFADLKQHWQQQLAQLSQEFEDGVATVAPSADACQYCHLHSLCRIDHLSEQDTESGGLP